ERQELEKLRGLVKELKDIIKDRSEELKKYTSENRKLKSKIRELEVKNEALNQEFTHLKSQVEAIEKDFGDLETLKKKAAEMEIELKEKDKLIDELEKKNEKLKRYEQILSDDPKFKILEILENVKQISVKRLSTALGMATTNVRMALKDLANLGIVKLEGDEVFLVENK
ncbi:MAG: winged helix-turn-helix transcriptional regulator, partial [Candidatus Odinarchaeia archaeon]